MPSAHAKLSPSASERWISCPASIQMEATLPEGWNEDSVYAREGTLAHALAEIEASHHFGLIERPEYLRSRRKWRREFNKEHYEEGTYEEMQAHIKDFVKLIETEMAKYPDSQVLFEQKMDSGVEKCWGTSDVVIFSPTHVQIIDLKYGAGIKVYAERNTQLMLYACGALDNFGDLLGDTKVIVMTIFQPRMEYPLSSWAMDPADLRAWRDDVARPAAHTALHEPDAPFGPSEKACQWCPFKGTCVARTRASLEADFGEPFVDNPDVIPVEPAEMTAEQMSQVLARIPAIRDWCNSVEAAALEMAYTRGEHIPGYKPVMSGGKRSIVDDDAAVKALTEAGYELEEVARTEVRAQTLGVLEKVVGKKKLPEILGPDILKKGEGKVSLVPENDPKPAISPVSKALEDFAEEPE